VREEGRATPATYRAVARHFVTVAHPPSEYIYASVSEKMQLGRRVQDGAWVREDRLRQGGQIWSIAHQHAEYICRR
jgi:hypothetical protein